MKISEERPWLKHCRKGIENIEDPNKILYRYLLDRISGYENYVALDYFGKTTTYGEMFGKIDRIADSFVALGIKKGDRIVFVTVNLPETIEYFYALNKIGAIPVIVEPRMTLERIEHFVEMTGANNLVVLDMFFTKVAPLIKKYNLKHVIVLRPEDSLHSFQRFLKKLSSKSLSVKYNNVVISHQDFSRMVPSIPAEEIPFEEDSVAVVTQTGGTTGVPKGVMLKNVSLNSVASAFEFSNIDLVPGDRFLNIMPIFTSYGVVCGVHMALTRLLQNILVPNFTPKKFAPLIAEHRPHAVIGVPSFYESLLYAKEMERINLSDLCFAVSGGDLMNPVLEDNINEFFAKHNCRYKICQGYGLSEATAVICFNHVYKRGSVGLPNCTSSMGIFNPQTNEECDPGVQGEICVCGPSVMKGYYDNKEETEKVLIKHDDGKIWLHSGDLGHFDEDGFLFFDGRIKFVIPRFDGHKNFPTQIEKVVNKHPEVKNCVVVGVKDMDHSQGMWPLVIVEVNPELNKDKIRKEILELCSKDLEERGQPCDVVFEDSIPLTLIGKNDVTTLSKKYFAYDYKNHLLKD